MTLKARRFNDGFFFDLLRAALSSPRAACELLVSKILGTVFVRFQSLDSIPTFLAGLRCGS